MGYSVSSDTYIRIGKLGRPHGLDGFMKLQSYADPVEQVLTYTLYSQSSSGTYTRFLLTDSTVFGNGKLIVKPVGVENPEAARMLTDTVLYMSRDELPTLPSDQFYWHELIGLRVVNHMGHSLGLVDSVFNTGASDVLVVKSGTTEHLLPYVPHVVLSVDLVAKQINVEWEI